MSALVNRVAKSALITIKPQDYLPKEEIAELDIKQFLFRELLLKEKDFREAMKLHDWNQYQGKVLTLHCSNDAIVPTWAFMLATSYASGVAEKIIFGDKKTATEMLVKDNINKADFSQFEGKRIVVKGCGDEEVPVSAYTMLTEKLRPFATSVMYGETCSTVPIFKVKR